MQSQTERFNTVVIGAGQYGIATGYYLTQNGIKDLLLLDAGQRVGDAWRNRWDSLRLFTHASWSSLPGQAFPAPPKSLPSKDEAADYLEQYATKFQLPVRLGVHVDRVTREGDSYVLHTGGDRIEAKNVVVATGPYHRPRIPTFASELDSSILQLHSSAYRNPGQLKEGDTLVVGAAVSGCEIALELKGYNRDSFYQGSRRVPIPGAVDRGRVILAGREVGVTPRNRRWLLQLMSPFITSRPRNSFIGKKLFQIARTQGAPLVDFTYSDIKTAGIERAGRMVGVSGGKPQLEDGRIVDVANVIWSTGYQVDFSWIDLPIFEADGYPRHVRGVVEDEPGLYFVGLIFLYSLSSHLWYGVPRDTKYVSDALVRRSRSNRTAPVAQPGVQANSTV